MSAIENKQIQQKPEAVNINPTDSVNTLPTAAQPSGPNFAFGNPLSYVNSLKANQKSFIKQ